jgi:hypothetical protein
MGQSATGDAEEHTHVRTIRCHRVTLSGQVLRLKARSLCSGDELMTALAPSAFS